MVSNSTEFEAIVGFEISYLKRLNETSLIRVDSFETKSLVYTDHRLHAVPCHAPSNKQLNLKSMKIMTFHIFTYLNSITNHKMAETGSYVISRRFVLSNQNG